MKKTREELKPSVDFQRGVYRHSKSGTLYHVAAIARDSETLEERVVYYESNLNGRVIGAPLWWIRPVEMFLDEIEVEGKMVPRFDLVMAL